MTGTEFLDRVESFISQSGMYATHFGQRCMGDGSFVFDLRGGRSVTLKTQAKVLDFIKQHSSINTDKAA